MNIPKKTLEAVRAQLKTEFDGIDDIIDKVINIMATWNDSNVRPIVVPVFGMTGVGKTSMITRMIELLNLNDRTYPITLGVSSKSDANTRPAAVLLKELGFYDYENSKSIKDVPSDSIIIADEVQKLRTKDEDGNEIETEFDELFQIMDDGKLKYILSNASEKARLDKWISILTKYLVKMYPDAIIENSLTKEKGIIEAFETLNMVYDARKDMANRWGTGSGSDDDDDDDGDTKPLSLEKLKSIVYQDSDKAFSKAVDMSFELVADGTISVAPFRTREILRDTLIELLTMDEITDVLKSLMEKQTLKEYCKKLEDLMKFINSPHYIDFHKSIIFLIGNLDEAFKVSIDLDPDVDADMFYRLTKEVNINDIKSALRSRFRPEQIARFGNNYVIYPSFSKETFKKIIKRYFEKDIASYSNKSGISVTYDTKILDLIYSEGVFPTQGTRPVLSTVNAFGIIFNEIDSIRIDNEIDTVHVSIPTSTPNFKTDTIQIHLKAKKGSDVVLEKEITYNLYLGKLRNPQNDLSRYVKATHELGHAFMTGFETGKLPSSIITTSSADSGGFCLRNISDITKKEITNIDSMRSDVKISLGGWVSERLMFPESYCALGSGSDIESIWNEVIYAYFSDGYVAPVAFGRGEKPDGVPHGVDDPEIMDKIQREVRDLKVEVEDRLRVYKPLIAYLSILLANAGSFTEEELRDNINGARKELGNEIVDRFFKEVEDRNSKKLSPELYLDVLVKSTGEKVEEKKKPNWFERLGMRIEKRVMENLEY